MSRTPALRGLRAAITTARITAVATAAWLALQGSAWAQATSADSASERAALTELRNTTLALIDALVEQGLLSRSKADELLKRARNAAPAVAAAAAPSTEPATAAWGQPPKAVVRVPYLPETARNQIKEELRNEVLGTARDEGWTDGRRLPGWLKSITVEGDVRVRAQGELFDANNAAADLYTLQNITQDSPAWSPDLLNTTHDRTRLTARARLGVTAKLSEAVSAGVRLATGATTGSPHSESQTLGTEFNRLSVGLDRAWVQWEPGQGTWLRGGRMAVPFDHSDMIWPDDLAVDGVAGKGELDLATGLYGFASAGAFPLQEFAISAHDQWLVGAQVGLNWAPDADWDLRGALAWYDFKNVEGRRETDPPPVGAYAGTQPYLLSQYPAAVRQRGNTLINLNAPLCITAPTTAGCASTATWGLASQFRPVDLKVGVVAKQLRPFQVSLDLDWVKNTGFDLADIAARSGVDVSTLRAKTTGYQLRLGLAKAPGGELKEKGDWRSYVAYRHFERDAWVDAFTDANWHGGGTGYKGFSVGGDYAFDSRATLGLRFTSTRGLDDGVRYTNAAGQVVGNMSSAPLRIDTVQVETNVKF